jgi:hypothetical protein
MVIARRCCNLVRSTRNRWLKRLLWVSRDWSSNYAGLFSSLTRRQAINIFFSRYNMVGVYKFSNNLVATSKLQAPEGRHRQVWYWGPNNIRHHRTKLIAQATWGTGFVYPCIKQVVYERELQTKDEFLPWITVAALPVRNNPAGIQKATSSVVKRARLCLEMLEVISKSNICN